MQKASSSPLNSSNHLLSTQVDPRAAHDNLPSQNQLVFHLQRTLGNRATQSLLRSPTPRLQRVLRTKPEQVTPAFSLPPVGKRLVQERLGDVKSLLQSYYSAIDKKKEAVDLLGYVRKIKALAADLMNRFDPTTREFELNQRYLVTQFNEQMHSLFRECETEILTLEPLVLITHPGAALPDQELGSGSTGTVFTLQGNTTQLYKPDNGVFTGQGAASKVGLAGKPASQRAVATARLDKLLGTNVTGNAELAVSAKGGRGHVMDRAVGKPLNSIDTEARKKLFERLDVKRQLYSLQTLDALTGEVDRNSGNIMVDESSGAVTGIDNETAFSPDKTTQDIGNMVKKSEQTLSSMKMFMNDKGQFKDQATQHKMTGGILNMGLPEYMDEAVARRILKLTVNDITEAVQSYLPKSEIDILQENFKALQAHALLLIEQYEKSPQGAHIIPSTPDDGGWQNVPSTPGKNYFYEKG